MILIDNKEYKIKSFNYSLYFLPKTQVFFTINFDFNIDNIYEKFLNKRNQKIFISNDIININDLIEKFKTAVNYLTKKGINEKLIIENSMLTPSCGAGGLNKELAKKAMKLTKELSIQLKEMY